MKERNGLAETEQRELDDLRHRIENNRGSVSHEEESRLYELLHRSGWRNEPGDLDEIMLRDSEPSGESEESEESSDEEEEPDAALGIDSEGIFHGKNPPAKTGWDKIEPGPRKGTRWRRTGAKQTTQQATPQAQKTTEVSPRGIAPEGAAGYTDKKKRPRLTDIPLPTVKQPAAEVPPVQVPEIPPALPSGAQVIPPASNPLAPINPNPTQGGWVPPQPQAQEPEAPPVAQPDITDPAHLRHSLSSSPVKSSKKLGGGANVTSVIQMEDGVKGVWKPASGEEAFLRESIPGEYWKREVLASKLADVMGFGDLVPATVHRNMDGSDGSVQHFADGAHIAAGHSMVDMYDGPEDLARAAVFDFVTLNTDRHAANWMLGPHPDSPWEKKLVLIDNGLSFPEGHKQPEYSNSLLLKEAMDRALPIPEFVKEWAHPEKRAAINETLAQSGLSEQEVALTNQRIDHVIESANSGHHIYTMYKLSGVRLLSELNK